MIRSNHVLVLLMGLLVISPLTATAATVEYHLTIDEKEVNFSGTPRQAMAVNGSIPGADAHFSRRRSRAHPCDQCDEGRVVDPLARPVAAEPHGWRAPFITFPPIKPGETFHYEFRIRQRGTYWYHSHTMLQEQKGLYGAIVILPRRGGVSGDRDRPWCSRIGRMKILTKSCAGSSAAANGRRFSGAIRSR